MDWLFVPLGNFIQWTFQFIEMAGMNFNILMILVGTALTLYWVLQMMKHKDDKGLFKK
jgi:hypothetical protein